MGLRRDLPAPRPPLSGLCARPAGPPTPGPRPCPGMRGGLAVPRGSAARPAPGLPRQRGSEGPSPSVPFFFFRSPPFIRLRGLSRPLRLRAQISICCGRPRPRPRRTWPHGPPGHSNILGCRRGTGISYSSLPVITHSLQATPYASSDQTTRCIGTRN